MKTLLLVGLMAWSAVANAEMVKCEGVWRNASDCPKGKVSERAKVAPARGVGVERSRGSVAAQAWERDAATLRKLKGGPRSAADKERDAKIKERATRAAQHPNLPAR